MNTMNMCSVVGEATILIYSVNWN